MIKQKSNESAESARIKNKSLKYGYSLDENIP